MSWSHHVDERPGDLQRRTGLVLEWCAHASPSCRWYIVIVTPPIPLGALSELFPKEQTLKGQFENPIIHRAVFT